MTVRSTLLTVATAAAALLGAATCQAGTTDWYPAGEGEAIQRTQPVHSTLTRAQVTAQVAAAQRAHTLAAAGELSTEPTVVRATPALARAEVKRETVAAARAGQLASAGEGLAEIHAVAPRAAKAAAAGQ